MFALMRTLLSLCSDALDSPMGFGVRKREMD
jgi:hypothetical protein